MDKRPATETVDFIKASGCRDVGIYFGRLDTEYPFWVLLQNKRVSGFRIAHVNVNNASARKAGMYPYNSIKPCAIIACFRGKEARKAETMATDQGAYRRKLISGPYEVFLLEGNGKLRQ